MASVASNSFAIRFDGFSWIHGLSAYTLISLVLAAGPAGARQEALRSAARCR
jgi:uncharacterized membrane protein